jgi:hypothetical protein
MEDKRLKWQFSLRACIVLTFCAATILAANMFMGFLFSLILDVVAFDAFVMWWFMGHRKRKPTSALSTDSKSWDFLSACVWLSIVDFFIFILAAAVHLLTFSRN